MSNFDIKRFAMAARWQCGMSLKNVLSFAAGLSFGYLFPMFGWLYPYLKDAEALDEGRLAGVQSDDTTAGLHVYEAGVEGVEHDVSSLCWGGAPPIVQILILACWNI